MSTRQRNSSTNPELVPKSDLPSGRKGTATAKHKTNLPFSQVRFNTFIYILSGLALAFIAINVWRMLQWKDAAGGWWNLALGKGPRGATNWASDGERGAEKGRANVEDRINALAEALGLPSRDLASAIADAVKSHVPPASLSSVSAAEATQSGSVVGVLVEEEQKPGTGMADKLSAFAGYDDPVGME